MIKTALVSNDPVVRQARPKMMVLLGRTAVSYTIGTPIVVCVLALCNVDEPLIKLIVELVLWQGATLWGAFMTSFTGYTVARSADKKTLARMENGEPSTKLLKLISKIGGKIS